MSYVSKNPDCSFNYAQGRVSRQSKAEQRRQKSGDHQRADGSGLEINHLPWFTAWPTSALNTLEL